MAGMVWLVAVGYVGVRQLMAVMVLHNKKERSEKMLKKYSWKHTGFKADANKVGNELEGLEVFGELNSEQVLKFAEENIDSELHKCFEWDNSVAGEKYRMFQASTLLCSISLEIKEEPIQKQRIYVSVKSSSTNKKRYKNIKEVLKNDEEYQQLINKARYELKSYKEKYETLVNKEDLKEVIFDIYKDM